MSDAPGNTNNEPPVSLAIASRLEAAARFLEQDAVALEMKLTSQNTTTPALNAQLVFEVAALRLAAARLRLRKGYTAP